MIDMGEVRRAAAILRRRWPSLDPHDAESCAGEAAVQVGTADQSRLVAVAKLRAIDLYRGRFGRHGETRSTVAVGLVGDPTVDGHEDTVVCRVDFDRWVDGLPLRLRLVVEAFEWGARQCEIAEALGVDPSRVSQLRMELRRKAAA